MDVAEKEETIRGMTMVCHEMNPNIRKKLISIGLLKMTEFGPLMLWLKRAFCACLQWHLYPLVIVGVKSNDPVRMTDDVSPSVTRIS